jgi:hypothetical protein
MSQATPLHRASHGELKRRLASLVDSDPERYSSDLGTERHKRITASEVDGVCETLGLGFVDGTQQDKRDAVMLKLGRDHRTGIRMWDSSDLRAVIERLETELEDTHA